MKRRVFIAGAGGLAAAAGCVGRNRSGGYPGGTVVVESEADDSLSVSVTAPGRSASLSATVSPGERVVRRAFVTAEAGESVTLRALLGADGDPIDFDFLPAGSGTAPPEVARLSVKNAVEASATWTATEAD